MHGQSYENALACDEIMFQFCNRIDDTLKNDSDNFFDEEDLA